MISKENNFAYYNVKTVTQTEEIKARIDIEKIDIEKLEKAKKDAEDYYKSVKEIYCPYFKEKIAFNAKGLEHVKFKGRWKARSRYDQYIRFRLIALAPQIIRDSHTLQGLYETHSFEHEKRNKRWDKILRQVTYYEFIAIIKRARARIIVKQVENEPKYFWSIIPFWKTENMTSKRIIHSGRPETD